MAMQKALHDKLKELLGEEKIGEDKVLELVVNAFDGAEAKEKVQKANEDLIKKRDELVGSEKELKEKVATLEQSIGEKDKEIEKVKDGLLSDEEKAAYLKIKETGMTPEVEARVNKLEKAFEEERAKREESDAKMAEAAERARQATVKERETALNNKIITALGDEKITGENAEFALLSMKSKGLFKLIEGDDGSFAESFYTKDADGKTFEATLSELCKDYATRHENLVSASGKTGRGYDDNSNNNNKPIPPNPQNLQEAEAQAAALLQRR